MKNEDDEILSSAPDGKPAGQQPTWRRDFPVDWPEDSARARRDFTRFLMLTSLAFTVGQFWIVLLRVFRQARGLPPEVEIARVDELSVGESKLFEYPGPGNACLLIRVTATEYSAFGQKCTHLSCPVLPRCDEGRLKCPCHQGAFDIHTGQPLAGPPRRPLPRVKLQVRGNIIYAAGLEEGII